jgi:hypothetical protein
MTTIAPTAFPQQARGDVLDLVFDATSFVAEATGDSLATILDPVVSTPAGLAISTPQIDGTGVLFWAGPASVAQQVYTLRTVIRTAKGRAMPVSATLYVGATGLADQLCGLSSG